jgi:hypothetical protein
MLLAYLLLYLPTQDLMPLECPVIPTLTRPACRALAALDSGETQRALVLASSAAQPTTKSKGNAEAQYLLAYFYQNGYAGLTPSQEAAKQWLTKSSDNGYTGARRYTHLFYVPLAVWGTLLLLVGETLLSRNSVNETSRILVPSSRARAIYAYFLAPVVVNVTVALWAKNAYFSGSELLRDIGVLVAGAYLGYMLVELSKRKAIAYSKTHESDK